ncbi:MAG: hypothetical protein GY832_26120 [Chloroflexi bacterium]|nr:hypothetical protein [Chloroflexota bacterium]
MNPDEYIQAGIIDLFTVAATQAAKDAETPEDAAFIPLAMFEAQTFMLKAWRRFVEQHSGDETPEVTNG